MGTDEILAEMHSCSRASLFWGGSLADMCLYEMAGSANNDNVGVR